MTKSSIIVIIMVTREPRDLRYTINDVSRDKTKQLGVRFIRKVSSFLYSS